MQEVWLNVAHLNFVPPPNQISKLHQSFVEQLTKWFDLKGFSLAPSLDAPPIVTVVAGSRIAADIKRDYGRVKGILRLCLLSQIIQ